MSRGSPPCPWPWAHCWGLPSSCLDGCLPLPLPLTLPRPTRPPGTRGSGPHCVPRAQSVGTRTEEEGRWSHTEEALLACWPPTSVLGRSWGAGPCLLALQPSPLGGQASWEAEQSTKTGPLRPQCRSRSGEWTGTEAEGWGRRAGGGSVLSVSGSVRTARWGPQPPCPPATPWWLPRAEACMQEGSYEAVEAGTQGQHLDLSCPGGAP